jgi:hypothetical protein
MKKLIITITILSFLNLISCYSQEQLTSDKYSFDAKDNITVITQDTVYKFSGDKCYVNNDTLFYKVVVTQDQKSMKLKTMTLPLHQTDKIEIERLDGLKTTLLVIGVVVVIVLAIGAATLDFSSNK